MNRNRLDRRAFLGAGTAAAAAALAGPALAQDPMANATEMEREVSQSLRHNISAFRMLDWRPYFPDLTNGAILCDIPSRALHFWNEDESIYRLYPTSVPMSEDLTTLGRTVVIDKRENPSWRPTPAMRERNPDWPEYVAGGDPMNPLGPYALYLSWEFYRIHGTHDTRRIGRRSSNGCIGLFNEHIAELYDLAKIGTQVMLI